MAPGAAKASDPGELTASGAPPPRPSEMLRRLRASAADEDKLLKILIGVSVAVHLLVFALQGVSLFKRAPIELEDFASIDADLIQDVESSAPPKSALPQAQKAPEAKINENMLPQLPKKFTIPEQTKPEEVVPEKVEEKVKEPEPPKEAVKVEEKKEPPPLDVKAPDEEVNKLAQQDALKRLALEKLRQQQKTAKETEAPEQDPLAKLAADVAANKKLNTGAIASLALQGKAKKWLALLDAAVRQNYSLPEVYNLKGATVRVAIAIAVNAEGNLNELEVRESSGDSAFDQLTMDAIKASVPLPRPPPELAGETVVVTFKP
jgi:protein TonB